MSRTFALRLAGACGFLAVAAGAFGAHSLHGLLEQRGTIQVWQTAALYHLVHSVALLALAQSAAPSRLAVGIFLTGITIFSGSLYLLAVTGLHWLGAITPLGGAFLLAGWIIVGFCPRHAERP